MGEGKSMKDIIISVNNLFFQYPQQEQWALEDVCLDIHAGEFLVLLGPNGSGKSTLARHLNGLLLPARGQVLVYGLSTADEPALWDIRKKVGMVFQNPDNQLVAALVEEEIAFGLENLGVSPDNIREQIVKISSTLGLQHLLSSPPHRLSGGQKQRVAIASVLALEPDVLVLDEPTSMLDPSGRKDVLEEILRLRERGKTIVLVTHDMNEALQADRVLVLNQGKIFLSGSPEKCFSQVAELKKIGLGIPPAAELAGHLRQRGFGLPDSLLRVEDWIEYLCGKS